MTKVEHLIACVAEEAGEIAQVAGKILRFGLYDTHEKTGNTPNIELLVSEINDLIGIVSMLAREGIDVSRVGNKDECKRKMERIMEYMDYAHEREKLELI